MSGTASSAELTLDLNPEPEAYEIPMGESNKVAHHLLGCLTY